MRSIATFSLIFFMQLCELMYDMGTWWSDLNVGSFDSPSLFNFLQETTCLNTMARLHRISNSTESSFFIWSQNCIWTNIYCEELDAFSMLLGQHTDDSHWVNRWLKFVFRARSMSFGTPLHTVDISALNLQRTFFLGNMIIRAKGFAEFILLFSFSKRIHHKMEIKERAVRKYLTRAIQLGSRSERLLEIRGL